MTVGPSGNGTFQSTTDVHVFLPSSITQAEPPVKKPVGEEHVEPFQESTPTAHLASAVTVLITVPLSVAVVVLTPNGSVIFSFTGDEGLVSALSHLYI